MRNPAVFQFQMANFSFVNQEQRMFASKKKKFGKAGDEGSIST